jgi:sterol desaturase/sphingolipid hydroxylase (fatty acid hydroxylase superfamily)
VAAAEPAEAAPAEERRPTLAARAAGAAVRFAEGYGQLAQREAKRDVQRVLTGLVMFGVAVVLTVMSGLIAQAFLVALLAELGVKPVWTLGGVLAADLFAALVLMLFARWMLMRPVLPQSRRILRETLDLLGG